jgi:hypothetical protein
MVILEMNSAENAEEIYIEYNGKPFSVLEVLFFLHFYSTYKNFFVAAILSYCLCS